MPFLTIGIPIHGTRTFVVSAGSPQLRPKEFSFLTVVGIVKYLHALSEKAAAAIFKHNLLMINMARSREMNVLNCAAAELVHLMQTIPT